MRISRVALASIIAAALFTPSLAGAGDLEDVKASFDRSVTAWNAMNVNGIIAERHDQAVSFGAVAPFPTDNNTAAKTNIGTLFTNSEKVQLNIIDPEFRVVGSAAVVWGFYGISVKPKDGPMETNFGQFTIAYAKTGGKWKQLVTHTSPIPSGGN